MLGLAEADARVVAAAEVGSLAVGPGDRFSDLDLTFGVTDVASVLADWTARLEREQRAVQLFDLPVGATIYRVFLLPGSLQVDLSFTPAAQFGPRGPRFRLLFGDAAPAPPPGAPTPARHLWGLAVHHAVRARFCVERGRLWQAEHWIGAARDHALELACRSRGLEGAYGRGFDELPAEVLERADAALPRAVTPVELRRALAATVALLDAESDEPFPG